MTKKEDKAFEFLKEHAAKIPPKSGAARYEMLQELKEYEQGRFRRSFVYVPLSFACLTAFLFVGTLYFSSQRKASFPSTVSVSEAQLESFLEESFSSYDNFDEDYTETF